jgi:hypothetical protein
MTLLTVKTFIQMLAILTLLTIFFIAAIPIGLIYILIGVFSTTPHVWEVLVAMDKFIAAALGWSGKYTVSAQCGVRDTIGARTLRAILNTIKREHCEDAAKGEGLILE